MSDLMGLLKESKELKIALSMLLTVVLYTVILYIVQKKLKNRKKTGEEKIFELARHYNCSEYALFERAAEKWNIPDLTIKEDFKKYLLFTEIPHYVRYFLRDHEDSL